MAAGRFAAERPAGRKYRSTAAGTMRQALVLSSKCRQYHVGCCPSEPGSAVGSLPPFDLKKPMCISVTPFHGPDASTVTQPTVKDSEVNSKTLTLNSSLASLFHHLSPARNGSHKIRLSRGISNKFEASFT